MDSDIKSFISELRNNTDIEISVFDKKGVFIAGVGKDGDIVPTNFNGVFSDVGLKRTLFKFKYKGKDYIGRILGSGKLERSVAYMITELAEKSFIKEAILTKEDFYRAILFGNVSFFQLEKYTKKFVTSNKPASVMILSTKSGRIEEVINVLETYNNDKNDIIISLDDSECALIKYEDKSTNEYHSITEYAQFLGLSVLEETGVKVSISIGGKVNTVSDLAMSFSQAVATQRMSYSENSDGEVHAFKEYILLKMLEDLPKYKLNEYLELLMDSKSGEVFADKDLTETAEAFLDNSLNISETSRKLYLHRNTLTYRLDKIENATGLDIRKFSDAVTFRLISVLGRLVKQ